MEFLEHLEKWKEQAVERANSVVTAKVRLFVDLQIITGTTNSLVLQQIVNART